MSIIACIIKSKSNKQTNLPTYLSHLKFNNEYLFCRFFLVSAYCAANENMPCEKTTFITYN